MAVENAGRSRQAPGGIDPGERPLEFEATRAGAVAFWLRSALRLPAQHRHRIARDGAAPVIRQPDRAEREG